MKLRLILLILIFLSGFGFLSAQNIEYGVGLDTNYMLIGDQQYLTFKVKSDAPVKIQFPQLKDTVVNGIEIVSGPVRDSLKEKDGKWLYQQKYLITVFDTGIYQIPSMPITVENESYNNVLRTEPLGIIVNSFQVDEQKGNYDIVMPYATPVNFAEILPWLLWGLLAVAIIAVIVWYILRRGKNKPFFEAKKEVIPPYVKAIRSLDEIKASKLYQSEKVKEYYTRLTDTVRQYLDDEFHIPAMEQTSFETIRSLEQCSFVEAAEREKVATMLQNADFVKFAKSMPLPDENVRYLDTAYDFVNSTNRKLKEVQEKEVAEKAKEENKLREE